MSMNLHLRGASWGEAFLLQTPTKVTYAALEEGADSKAIYFAWIDTLCPVPGPVLKYPKEQEDYRLHVERMREHKAQVEQYLAANPGAEWFTI